MTRTATETKNSEITNFISNLLHTAVKRESVDGISKAIHTKRIYSV